MVGLHLDAHVPRHHGGGKDGVLGVLGAVGAAGAAVTGTTGGGVWYARSFMTAQPKGSSAQASLAGGLQLPSSKSAKRSLQSFCIDKYISMSPSV